MIVAVCRDGSPPTVHLRHLWALCRRWTRFRLPEQVGVLNVAYD